MAGFARTRLLILIGLFAFIAFTVFGVHHEPTNNVVRSAYSKASDSIGSYRPQAKPKTPRAERVVIYEYSVHDEVTGSLAYSLIKSGIKPTIYSNWRFKFDEVLNTIVTEDSYEHHRVGLPATDPNSIEAKFENNEIDVIVFTTCTDGMVRFKEQLDKTSAKVVCVVHHGGPLAYHHLRRHIIKTADEKRLTVVTLSDHVKATLENDLLTWSEVDAQPAYYGVPVVTFLPIFDYPRMESKVASSPFPAHAIIQGNLEQGRRDYTKIVGHMNASVHADPALWGYRFDTVKNKYVPASPDTPGFQLRLMGKANPSNPINIPEELSDVIVVIPSPPYPDFYKEISQTDLLLTAFGGSGNYHESASSSVAAAVIARTPILTSDRHTVSYTYLEPPATIQKDVFKSDVDAIAEMRRSGKAHPYDRDAWSRYHDGIQRQNSQMWATVLG